MDNPYAILDVTHAAGTPADDQRKVVHYFDYYPPPLGRMGQRVAQTRVGLLSGEAALLFEFGSGASSTWVAPVEKAPEDFRLITWIKSSGEAPGLVSFADPQGEAAPANERDNEVRAIFKALADEWEAETRVESSLSRIFANEKYLQIVGLGPDALPYLLDRFRHEPERWLGALKAVTRADPAPLEHSREGVVAAWEDWARSHSLLEE
jgi:hypothetical protein